MKKYTVADYIASTIVAIIIAIPICMVSKRSQTTTHEQNEKLYRTMETQRVAKEEYRLNNEQLIQDAKIILSDVEIPDDIKSYCEEAGEAYNISPEFLQAIAWEESRCIPTVTNGSCIGVMQVSQKWHSDRMKKIGISDLTEPKGNILVASDYLIELFEEYESPEVVLAVYNGDSRALEGGYTSEYAKNILKNAEALERVHGK